LIWRKLKFSV